MYYTYLINTNNNFHKSKLLCLESSPDYEQLINCSCDLLLFKFFEGFEPCSEHKLRNFITPYLIIGYDHI